MKIKNILIGILAAASTLFVVSCEKEFEVSSLDNFKVSSSMIGIPVAGGTVTTDVSATEAWSIADVDKLKWLTVSPSSGVAGDAVISFSAEANQGSERTVTIAVNVGEKTQYITVTQAAEGVTEAPLSTVAQANAGKADEVFRLRGTVTGVYGSSWADYGNVYIQDETGTILIYGLLNDKGQNPKDAGGWDKFGIEIGDIITVQGPISVYKEVNQLANATLIKVEKSLISLEPSEVVLESNEASSFEVTVEAKTSGVTPISNVTWARVTNVAEGKGDKLVYTVSVDKNEDFMERTAVITFKAPKATKNVTVKQPGAPLTSGTIEKPFTIAEAIEAAQKLESGAETSQEFYVKGKFARWNKESDAFGANTYGNATFWLSEDGTSLNDKTKEFEVYRTLWFNNQKWAEGNANLCQGDVIVLKLNLKNYNGTSENGSKVTLVSVNGLTTDAEGLGNVDFPLTVTGAISF